MSDREHRTPVTSFAETFALTSGQAYWLLGRFDIPIDADGYYNAHALRHTFGHNTCDLSLLLVDKRTTPRVQDPPEQPEQPEQPAPAKPTLTVCRDIVLERIRQLGCEVKGPVNGSRVQYRMTADAAHRLRYTGRLLGDNATPLISIHIDLRSDDGVGRFSVGTFDMDKAKNEGNFHVFYVQATNRIYVMSDTTIYARWYALKNRRPQNKAIKETSEKAVAINIIDEECRHNLLCSEMKNDRHKMRILR